MVGRAVHGVRTLLARHPSPVAWGGYKKKAGFLTKSRFFTNLF